MYSDGIAASVVELLFEWISGRLLFGPFWCAARQVSFPTPWIMMKIGTLYGFYCSNMSLSN
jgi:hypothetical protein